MYMLLFIFPRTITNNNPINPNNPQILYQHSTLNQVDLVINAELPRRADDYIHRVGRTARAGRRGLAVSLVGEGDVNLVHACEELAGRDMVKCEEVRDKDAVKIVSSVSKAQRLTKVRMMELGFDELVQKRKERKAKDNKERQRVRAKMKKLK